MLNIICLFFLIVSDIMKHSSLLKCNDVWDLQLQLCCKTVDIQHLFIS